ncbi:MAG: amino acid aminotransferase [Pseudomonadota bacterium]
MLFDVEPLPGDPILELMAAYRADASDRKVDLGVGVYQDDAGNTPVLTAVSEAEAQILKQQTTKSYVGIAGAAEFNDQMATMLFGASHPSLQAGRIVTVQSAGGSGGLRVAGELIRQLRPQATVWVTTPTWPNHTPLLSAAGLSLQSVRYYSDEMNAVDFPAFIADLGDIPEGDVLLLHGCCHNPTGADLNQEQWAQVAQVCRERGLLPFVDIAYQGFAEGLESDAFGARLLAEHVPEMVVVTSCSKNFGLYRERVGALSVVTASASTAPALRSHLLKVVRAMISMPPDHGARIVATILASQALRQQWLDELESMRSRMQAQRAAFVAALPAPLAERFAFVAEQRGMFSLLGITRAQIDHLRSQWHVYIVGSSRVNVAGLTSAKVDYLAEALAATLAEVPVD